MSLALPLPAPALLPYQDELRPFVPTVLGSVDYRRFGQQLNSIEPLLLPIGIENRFVETTLAQEPAKRQTEAKQTGKLRTPCPSDQILFQKNAVVALRCSVRRTLNGESYRCLSQTLADATSGVAVFDGYGPALDFELLNGIDSERNGNFTDSDEGIVVAIQELIIEPAGTVCWCSWWKYERHGLQSRAPCNEG